MLSLRELQRAVRILQIQLADSTIVRAVQTEDLKLILTFRGPGGDRLVQLACQPALARLSSPEEAPQPPPHPLSFAQYFIAHLHRARFGGVRIAEGDRQITFLLETIDGSYDLILSIFGSRSNIYLLNSVGRLVHALRPLEETRRDLTLGDPWSEPSGTLRSEGLDRWDSIDDGDYLQTIEREYRMLEQVKQAETLARKIESVIGREESFLERKVANLQEDLGEARQAEECKRKGELLKGILHEIRTGEASATAIDYSTGQEVVIPLDPTMTPAENLEAYFGRYQKERRGASVIEVQLRAVSDSQQEIQGLSDQLKKITSDTTPRLQELTRLASHPRLRRLLSRFYPTPKNISPTKPAGPKREIPSRLAPKRYRTAEGLEIWVGRSDEGNDYLTTRLARGNDLFFHLEGFPGSHVVLRTEGRTDPPPESMLAACELAVHFSKMKNASRADVHVACIKDVKKPKGVKRGLVYVTRGKTVHLRRDARRLEDILASRLEE